LNPGPPAPQAGVIIRQHGKSPASLDLTIVLDDEPAYAEYNNRIIKTLEQTAADGRKRETLPDETKRKWTELFGVRPPVPPNWIGAVVFPKEVAEALGDFIR
jgi:hypothetical protein